MPAARATASVLHRLGPLCGAVARDVGVEDRRPRPPPPRRGPAPIASRSRTRCPAVHRDAAVGGVDRHDDPVLEAPHTSPRNAGIERGARAHHGPARARLQHRLARRRGRAARRPPATGMAERRDDRPHQRGLRRPPAKAPSRSTTCRRGAPCGLPAPRHRHGIVGEHRLASARPWQQAHAAAGRRSMAGIDREGHAAAAGGRGRPPRSSRAAAGPSAGSSRGGTGWRTARRGSTAAGKVDARSRTWPRARSASAVSG